MLGLLRRVPRGISQLLLVLPIALTLAWSSARASTDENSAALPSPSDGVTELKFRELYKMPIGPRGLEPSEKLLSLAGKCVRMVGYMVRENEAQPRVLILAPFPLSAPDTEDGPADDFPPQIVYVHLPQLESGNEMPWTPQLLAFEGTLEIGPREESDGRISAVRLIVH